MIRNESLKPSRQYLITTTSKEQYEITVREHGYLIKDLIPPIEEMPAAFIHSIKPTKGPIAIARPEETMFFDGIAKGFHFAWRKEGSTELLTTKGRIESCTTRISMGNLQFNLQLLEAAGRKFVWSELGKSFSVKTGGGHYDFGVGDGDYYFEGRKLVNILSLYKSRKIAIPELFSFESEYDVVSGTLFYNHPFIVFTEDNGGMKDRLRQ
ncbi:hypothetical protein [Paenibacillus taichungensis]